MSDREMVATVIICSLALSVVALVGRMPQGAEKQRQQLLAVQHALGMRQLSAEPVGHGLWKVMVEGQTRLVDTSGKQPVVYGRVAVSAAWAETLPLAPDTKLVAVDAKRLLPRLPAPGGEGK